MGAACSDVGGRLFRHRREGRYSPSRSDAANRLGTSGLANRARDRFPRRTRRRQLNDEFPATRLAPAQLVNAGGRERMPDDRRPDTGGARSFRRCGTEDRGSWDDGTPHASASECTSLADRNNTAKVRLANIGLLANISARKADSRRTPSLDRPSWGEPQAHRASGRPPPS